MTLYDAFLRDARLVHSSANLSITVARPASWIFFSRVEGHLTLHGASLIDAEVRGQVADAARSHALFNDWSTMTDYDGAARVLLTDLARDVLPACEAVHVLVGSRLVAFGVAAANLVLRKLTVHAGLSSFERAIAAAAALPVAPQRPVKRDR